MVLCIEYKFSGKLPTASDIEREFNALGYGSITIDPETWRLSSEDFENFKEVFISPDDNNKDIFLLFVYGFQPYLLEALLRKAIVSLGGEQLGELHKDLEIEGKDQKWWDRLKR